MSGTPSAKPSHKHIGFIPTPTLLMLKQKATCAGHYGLRSGGVTPLTFIHGTAWKWVVNFTSRSLDSHRKICWFSLNRRLGDIHIRSAGLIEERNSVLQPEEYPDSLVVQPQQGHYTHWSTPAPTLFFKIYCQFCFFIYRMIQEESALLWEMIVWVILSKKVHTNMGPILNGYGVMGIF